MLYTNWNNYYYTNFLLAKIRGFYKFIVLKSQKGLEN